MKDKTFITFLFVVIGILLLVLIYGTIVYQTEEEDCPNLWKLELQKAFYLTQIEWNASDELNYAIQLQDFKDAGGCNLK